MRTPSQPGYSQLPCAARPCADKENILSFGPFVQWRIGTRGPRYGLIHGDLSFGNLLWRDGRPALVDFADRAYGPYAYDLAVVPAGAWGKPGYDVHRAALLRGYRNSRTMSSIETAAPPALMAARAASLIYWCAGRSPNHPWIDSQWEWLRAYLAP